MKVSSPPLQATEMTPNHGNFSCLTSRVAHLESKLTVRKHMMILGINERIGFCEAQGKGRARGGPRKVTQW